MNPTMPTLEQIEIDVKQLTKAEQEDRDQKPEQGRRNDARVRLGFHGRKSARGSRIMQSRAGRAVPQPCSADIPVGK